jgi:heme-degrading monooxygenase HmoA
MFVLHVAVTLKAGRAQATEAIFSGPFKSAISAQPGFRAVSWLRPLEGGEHVLSIAFDDQTLQQQWVATELHGKVWSQLKSNFEHYSLKTFIAT